MTRVAYVCADPGVPVFGRKGASIHVREVIRAFLRKGLTVDLFALSLDGEPPEDFGRVRVHAFAESPIGSVADRERACLGANGALRDALSREGPFDLVYERYSLWSYEGMEWARDHRVPGILELNAPLIDEQAAHRDLYDRAGAEGASRRAFRAATTIVAVSKDVATYLGRFPEAKSRVHVVPNGVDPGRFPPDLTPTASLPRGAFSVGFVGSLKPWHGLPVLLQSFEAFRARHPDARLLIVGDGPARPSLEADAARRGLDGAVTFVGSVAHEEIPGLLVSMDVAVAPYPTNATYFSPLKVYEYMAAGRPVVASRVGQLAEILRDGVDGLLVPPDDADGLTAALERLHADPALRSCLGAAARARVLDGHTWDAVADRILAIAGVQATKPEVVA